MVEPHNTGVRAGLARAPVLSSAGDHQYQRKSSSLFARRGAEAGFRVLYYWEQHV